MKLRNLLLLVAASVMTASPTGAASKIQICPSDLAGAKAITKQLIATGEPKRTPSTGYERVTYERPNLVRGGRAVQKVVVERSANRSKGTGHYLISFFATGGTTNLIPLLKAQLPATKCDKEFCSGSTAVFPGAEGSLEYGSVQELSKVEMVFRCKYRDDAYGKLMKEGAFAPGS